MQLEKVFLGNLKADQRKYLKYVVEHLEKEKPRRYFVPCVGQFAIAKTLVDAGVNPNRIITSDISIFSSVLGYYLSGKPISELPIEWADEATKELCLGQESEAHNAATIFYLLKLGQLREGIMYEAMFLKNLIVKKKDHMERVVKDLQDMKQKFEGITYEVRDLRDYTHNPDLTENDVVIMNPPVFGKGYEKMFDSDFMYMRDKVAEFDWKKEYHELYIQAKESKALFIIYRSKNSNGIDKEDIYFAKNLKIDKTDYWVITKPLPIKRVLKARRIIEVRPYKNLPILTNEDEITEKSNVTFVKVGKEHALYYRDLFAHRLGDVEAEIYFLMLIDGKVCSAVGFHTRDLLTLRSDHIYETFGFSVFLQRYPRINCCMMQCITTTNMKEVLVSEMSQKNRIYNLVGMRTTCLCKFRDNRLNAGFMTKTLCEKLDNDTYRLQYETLYRDERFSDVLKTYFKEREEFLKKYPDKKWSKSSPKTHDQNSD